MGEIFLFCLFLLMRQKINLFISFEETEKDVHVTIPFDKKQAFFIVLFSILYLFIFFFINKSYIFVLFYLFL